jgi:phage shock protein PspC (stress-responsive transcriptional regulator)
MSQDIKRMRRSKHERMISGVCGGIAEYFFIDPVIVRGVFVLLSLMNGIGIILYIALAIIMPEEGEEAGTVSGSESVGPGPTAPVATPGTSESPEFRRRRQLLLLLTVLGIMTVIAPFLALFSFLGLLIHR